LLTEAEAAYLDCQAAIGDAYADAGAVNLSTTTDDAIAALIAGRLGTEPFETIMKV
jgi:hypothetical protein